MGISDLGKCNLFSLGGIHNEQTTKTGDGNVCYPIGIKELPDQKFGLLITDYNLTHFNDLGMWDWSRKRYGNSEILCIRWKISVYFNLRVRALFSKYNTRIIDSQI